MTSETASNQGNNANGQTGESDGAVGSGGMIPATGSPQLSPQDLRNRRLEALGQRQIEVGKSSLPAIGGRAGGFVPETASPTLKQAPPPSAASASPPLVPPPPVHPSSLKAPPTSPAATPRNVTIKTPPAIYVDDDDENDAALQAALAMSLAVDSHDHNTPSMGAAFGTELMKGAIGNANNSAFNGLDDDDDGALKTALRLSLQDVGGKVANRMLHGQGSPNAPIPRIECDDTKMQANVSSAPQTWIESPETEWYKSARPTNVLAFHEIMWDSNITTENDKLRWVGQGINFRNYDEAVGKLDGPIKNDSLLAAVISNFGPWGLTQAHGGPCGVLAAVQAELLRILLFGPRHIDGALDYPIMLTNDLQVRAQPDMTERPMQQGLAMSIAIILARSALMPPADDKLAEESKPRDESARIVLPAQFLRWHELGTRLTPPPFDLLAQSMPDIALSWDSFEPWSPPPPNESGSTKSTWLHTYTISSNNNASGPFAGPKRQKTHANMTSMSIDQRIVQLAHAISAFLLYPSAPGRPTPLDAFRQPGGVILLAMSLVSSRGPKLIQSDMDVPAGTKLTSQFGHCGQELINLLLTGQAVSNVFDNTLTPSGELMCKGIQSRPAIGYLSQLEAMRYLEVGGYYKTPRFPIWVVGSASHFTVMFGDASCLNESQSDILLERCRRAFKAIEGGEENGFIATHHLGKFLKSLDLEYPDHNIQTLAATIEVDGAGIILWDDLWKHTSRLLMGASLETVLQLSDTMDPSESLEPLPLLLPPGAADNGIMDQQPSSVPTAASLVDSIPPASVPYSSDEEMAKRIEAEWNSDEVLAGESIPTHGPAAVAASSPASPVAEALSFPGTPVRPRTDEEIARELQAQWDAELPSGALANIGSGGSIGAVSGSPTPANWKGAQDDMSVSTVTTNLSNFDGGNDKEDTVIGPKPAPQSQIMERYGKTFQLYHYNGLRGGALKPFRVTRLTPEEAVGASISLVGNGTSSNGSGDLEDVIRTKWPSSMINWLGHAPPSID